jgi:hypothetical protein
LTQARLLCEGAALLRIGSSSAPVSTSRSSPFWQVRVGRQQDEVAEAARLNGAKVSLVQREQPLDAEPLGSSGDPGIGNSKLQVAILSD